MLAVVLAFCTSPGRTDEISDFWPAQLGDEWYMEGWDQLFYFTDGSLLVIQITVYNMGLGDNHSGVFGILVTPEGDEHVLTQSRKEDGWSFAKDRFDIQIADHRFSGAHPGYTLQVRKNEGEFEVRFEAEAEPWQLGRTLQLGREYQYLSFLAPLLRANGRYRLAGSDKLAVEPWQMLQDGRGFAARYVNSTGLGDLIRSSTRIVALGDSVINPIIHTLQDEKGDTRNYLGLFEAGRLIGQIEGFDMGETLKLELADDDSRQIPDGFEVDIVGEGFSLKGAITSRKLLLRIDPVDWVKPPVQYLLKKINTPIQYRYLASYDLAYTDGDRSLRLQGDALMDHIVMRDERSKSKQIGNR